MDRDRRRRRIARRSNWLVTNRPGWQRAWSRLHGRLYKLTGGRFIPRWFDGAPVMVLETVGRRSGRPRANPILYLRDGERLVVMASNAGNDRTPQWCLNLLAAGEATVVIGGQRTPVRVVRTLEGAERERVWPSFAEMYPQADDYTEFTDREIQLVELEPA